jgi:acyl-CoA synthetase (AMP-forming)/AMP-acid ligase II
VRGYTVMGGYWADDAETARTIDSRGWLHTGDIGIMDKEGNVTITDRLKDMYVVGGFNAYPAEIEALLRGCPGVAQVAVVGVPDDRLGEVGCAYVVPQPPAKGSGSPEVLGESVRQWSRQAMANYKVPRYVVLVDTLPVNASGKVLKRELRQRFADGADAFVSERSG